MQETIGTIVEVKDRGINHPNVITVRYEAGGIEYQITETVKLKSEPIKIGFLPIGQRKIPVMGNTAVGTEVVVVYDPDCPEKGKLRDNIGKINS